MPRRTVGSPTITFPKRAKKHRQDSCELCNYNHAPVEQGVVRVSGFLLCQDHAMRLCMILVANEHRESKS